MKFFAYQAAVLAEQERRQAIFAEASRILHLARADVQRIEAILKARTPGKTEVAAPSFIGADQEAQKRALQAAWIREERAPVCSAWGCTRR